MPTASRSSLRTACRRLSRLGVVLGLAACAPAHNPPPPAASSLTIDFLWRPAAPGSATRARTLRSEAPAAFVIEWDPAEFAASDIQYLADQQCLAWNRQARAAGEAVAHGGREARRFDCNAPLIKH